MVLQIVAAGSIALLGACQQLSGTGFPWSEGGASRQSLGQQDESSWQQSRKDQVQRAQQILSKLGYGVGEADGIAGQRTRKAVSAYQRDRGLPRDAAL